MNYVDVQIEIIPIQKIFLPSSQNQYILASQGAKQFQIQPDL